MVDESLVIEILDKNYLQIVARDMSIWGGLIYAFWVGLIYALYQLVS